LRLSRILHELPELSVDFTSDTYAICRLTAGLLFIAWLSLLASLPVLAHPEDEFCTADSGLDPALCAALAAADSAEASDESPDGMLDDEQSARIKSAIKIDRPWWATAALYLKLGYEHILPKGVDHVLFVLALFFACTRLKPLILQISVFTIAHTITLGLAASGIVSMPGRIVEPLIALSIAFVAVENLLTSKVTPWRLLVVFGFGLFHGLGFASVLLGLGLPQGQFLPALVSFNVGVELGQITVILAAWWLFHRWFQRDWYRARVLVPASIAIGATGTWWAFQRIFM
jgi:hypothetical protein